MSYSITQVLVDLTTSSIHAEKIASTDTLLQKCNHYPRVASYHGYQLSSCVCLSVCLSVCPSVTSRCPTEMAKRRITQTTPHDSPRTLVFCCRKSRQNSNGVTPNGCAKCSWGRLNTDAVAANWRLSTLRREALSTQFGRKFITLSVHLICLQHVRGDPALITVLFYLLKQPGCIGRRCSHRALEFRLPTKYIICSHYRCNCWSCCQLLTAGRSPF